ncbi:MAG: arsenate reductase ArsC [Candidatus Aminicenantaceae bacterium]
MGDQPAKKKILFVCTHNTARSQMAEGLMNSLYGNEYEAASAGTEPTTINPYAVQVMSEIGIDISNHRSKSIYEFTEQKFDYVITVCDHAKETCPFFPGGMKRLHFSFEDPASFKGNKADTLSFFRRIRDEIKLRLETLIKELEP